MGWQIAAVLFLLLGTAVAAQAQTLTVLHAFTGAADGANPVGSGLSIDRAGNLYGGTGDGGLQGSQCLGGLTCGTIFKLTRRSSGWTFDTLYSFHGSDGATPDAPLVFGPDGAIYGTTFYGGTGCSNGCGIVLRLQPPPTFCASVSCPWTQTVLYQFTGDDDGSEPGFGALSFDPAGNTYGCKFSANHPGAPDDVFWCQADRSKSGHPYAPNSMAGADLRASSVCNQPFLLKSSDLSMYVQNGQYANNNVACFSNCGYYEYPGAPAADCQDTKDSKCGAWRAYCCQATAWGGNKCTPGKDKCEFGECQPEPGGGGICPGKSCTTDSECAPYATCWAKAQGGLNTCACAGYAKKVPCDPVICTNVNQPAAEPPFLKCSQSASLPGIAGPSTCIGDDTVHTVFPRAYTWPNDPQTYNCDNTTFTVSVSGNLAKGQTSGAVPIPLCSELPAAYGYDYTIKNACGDPSKTGFTFASAVVNPHPGNQWACNIALGTVNNAGGVPPGVLCAWHPLK